MTQKRKHIAVLDPGQNTPELDAFNRLLHRYPQFCFSYHLPAMFGIESLNDIDDRVDAVIVFGSGASALDQEPWQAPMNTWLQHKMADLVPCLGICYGHQLFAHLFGGQLGFVHPTHQKEIGLRQVTAKGPLKDKSHLKQGPLVVSHRECVLSLPDSCELLASSELVSCEAFRHKNWPVWGIQAHPEAGPGFLRNQSIYIEDPLPAFEHGSRWIDQFLAAYLS